MPKTSGDDLFERYLHEHGYDPGPHEPDLSAHGIQTRPDYLVTRDGVRLACEMEQFKAGASKLEKRMASQRFGSASAPCAPSLPCASALWVQTAPSTARTK